MKKQECLDAMQSLADEWLTDKNLSKIPKEELHFSDFIEWIRRNYPRYLQFRSSISVEYDVELWFDKYFNQAWKR